MSAFCAMGARAILIAKERGKCQRGARAALIGFLTRRLVPLSILADQNR